MGSALLIGVNLAGAEFGSNVPGTFGVDYTYPTHAEIDYYAAKGLSVIRLPFLWERLQRSEFGSLDATELARLDDVVSYATSKGLNIEIEPHDYGYGFGALIGSAQTPNSAFADFWSKLASHFKSNPKVIFGLMNEPFAQSDFIDLRDVAFGPTTSVTYSLGNAGNTSGTLSVTDGIHSAHVALLGQYVVGQFTLASDGGGGTKIGDPPVVPDLDVSMAALATHNI